MVHAAGGTWDCRATIWRLLRLVAGLVKLADRIAEKQLQRNPEPCTCRCVWQYVVTGGNLLQLNTLRWASQFTYEERSC